MLSEKAAGTSLYDYMVVSISPQVRASLAAKYNQTVREVAARLTSFFHELGIHSYYYCYYYINIVIDTTDCTGLLYIYGIYLY